MIFTRNNPDHYLEPFNCRTDIDVPLERILFVPFVRLLDLRVSSSVHYSEFTPTTAAKNWNGAKTHVALGRILENK